MAARAKTSSWLVAEFQNNFTEIFLLWPFTKIAKMFCWIEQNGHKR